MTIRKQKKELGNGMLQGSDTIVFSHREEVKARIHVVRRSRKQLIKQLQSAFKQLMNILDTTSNPWYEFEIRIYNTEGVLSWSKIEVLCHAELERIGLNEFLEIVNVFFEKRKARMIEIIIWR